MACRVVPPDNFACGGRAEVRSEGGPPEHPSGVCSTSLGTSSDAGSATVDGDVWRGLNPDSLPIALAELELASPGTALDVSGEDPTSLKALTLVRLHGHPLGVVLLERCRELSCRAHLATVWSALGGAINAHLTADGIGRLAGPEDLAEPVPGDRPGCRRGRSAAWARGPLISVVVATRERPDSLHRCLSSVLEVDYPRFEVVVVDNDPTTSTTAELVASCFAGRVRYVRETRRGLGAAHNRGIAEAAGDVIAFVDDDVVVDREWLSALAEGFAVTDQVGCVTGLILPGQLDTPAQVLLERHGGFAKGFDLQIVDRDEHRPADPLFPFRSGRFGSGANMAFDAALLRRLGGFDPATGTGTFARGGDDLTAFFRILVGGSRLVYQPGALVWHRHHRDMTSSGRQAYGYGVGFGAYLASAIAHEPAMLPSLLRRAPAGLVVALRRSAVTNSDRYQDWPHEFLGLERRGMIFGPFAYLVSRWRARGAERLAEAVA